MARRIRPCRRLATVEELGTLGEPALLDPIGEVLAQVRRAKTEAKVSQRAAVSTLTVETPASLVDHRGRVDDLKEAGSIADVSWSPATGHLDDGGAGAAERIASLPGGQERRDAWVSGDAA